MPDRHHREDTLTDSKRLLVLGIDSASSALLKRWSADGSLPNIARLLATGVSADTRGPEAFYLGSTWPTFFTGVGPGGHGVYWLDQLKTGTYQIRTLAGPDFGRRRSLWEVLGDSGRRVLVVDVPLARLIPDLNGRQVVEWRTHDVAFGMHTAPATLKAHVLETIGEHPGPYKCDAPRRSLDEYLALADALTRGADARGRLTRQLLAAEPWDFAIQVFSEAHCVGHQMWHFHDPEHPAYDAEIARTTGDLVRTVYQAIDTAIGKILEDVQPDTTVVLMTLHGMACFAGSTRLLRDMLVGLGVTMPASHDRPASTRPRDRFVHFLRSVYHLIPRAVRRPFYEWRSHVKHDVLGRPVDMPFDPARSQCFPIEMGGLIGAIRLNLVGREPAGTVQPGAEADAFCGELTERLLEFVEPGTGRRVVNRVLRTRDIFHGPALNDLPDLLVEWDLTRPRGTTVAGNGAEATMRAESPRTGLIEVVNEYCRTGDHRIEGMFVACRPGMAPRQLDRTIPTVDLAPTFAAMMGTTMPDVEGTVIPELMSR